MCVCVPYLLLSSPLPLPLYHHHHHPHLCSIIIIMIVTVIAEVHLKWSRILNGSQMIRPTILSVCLSIALSVWLFPSPSLHQLSTVCLYTVINLTVLMHSQPSVESSPASMTLRSLPVNCLLQPGLGRYQGFRCEGVLWFYRREISRNRPLPPISWWSSLIVPFNRRRKFVHFMLLMRSVIIVTSHSFLWFRPYAIIFVLISVKCFEWLLLLLLLLPWSSVYYRSSTVHRYKHQHKQSLTWTHSTPLDLSSPLHLIIMLFDDRSLSAPSRS